MTTKWCTSNPSVFPNYRQMNFPSPSTEQAPEALDSDEALDFRGEEPLLSPLPPPPLPASPIPLDATNLVINDWFIQEGESSVDRLQVLKLINQFIKSPTQNSLDISGARIFCFPDVFLSLYSQRLEHLNLASTTLTKLPEGLRFPSLQTISLYGSNIETLPEQFDAPDLRLLDLRMTKITTLPAWVMSLPKECLIYVSEHQFIPPYCRENIIVDAQNKMVEAPLFPDNIHKVVKIYRNDPYAPVSSSTTTEDFHESSQDFMRDLNYRAKIKIQGIWYYANAQGMTSDQHIKGKGNIGRVFRAYTDNLSQTYAIKVAQDPNDTRQGFLDLVNEARTLREIGRIQSPFLSGAYSYGIFSNRVVTVMSHIDGADLIECMNTLRLIDCLQVCRDAAKGIEEMHANQLVHQDIKPDNIMCHGFPVRGAIVDYGFTKRLPDESDFFPYDPDRNKCGTPGYYDPVNLVDGVIGKTTDVFAFGVSLYVAVSKTRPPSERSLKKLSPDCSLLASDLSSQFWQSFVFGKNPITDNEVEVKKHIACLIKECTSLRFDSRPSMKMVRIRLDYLLNAHSL